MTNRGTKIATGIAALSGLLNIALGLRVLSMERSLRPVPRIQTGARLEDIVGADPDGGPLTVRFADSPTATVLLILRPGCSWCAQNMPNWQALIRAKSRNFHFVVVSLSAPDLKQYLDANKLALPAVVPTPEKNPTIGGVTGTPQTIVVGTDGIVQKVWFGAYTPDVKHDVEAFFGLDLPFVVQSSS